MPNIEYVETDERDLDVIQPLWERLREHHSTRSVAFAESFAATPFSERKAGILAKARSSMLRLDLARDSASGAYVGYCVSLVSSEGEGEIESIFVAAAGRGQGIGDCLMRRALAWMDAHAVKEKSLVVVIGNEEVLSFYSRYRFYPKYLILEQLPEPVE